MGDEDGVKRKKSKRNRKHAHKGSSSDRHRRSSSASSDTSEDSRRRRKEKKKSKKAKRKAERVDALREEQASIADGKSTLNETKSLDEVGPSLALAEPAAKPKGPMTKEQWEAQRNTLHRVADPGTGRTRLVRGDGEIVEEIVSRERHISINKAATKADGAYFETVLGLKRHK